MPTLPAMGTYQNLQVHFHLIIKYPHKTPDLDDDVIIFS